MHRARTTREHLGSRLPADPVCPQATLVKRELLWIPFFGWAFALLKPIAIDRGNPRKALRKLIREGRQRLHENMWIVLFPEGTRMPVDEIGKFQAGGCCARLCNRCAASRGGARFRSVLPPHQFRKRAGWVTVKIAPTIDPTGKTTKEINALASATMATLMTEIANSSGSIT